MLLKNRLLHHWLCIFSLFFVAGASSCSRGITFNPDFHVGDSELLAIVPEEGHPVMCEEQRFNNFSCMHKEKVKELRAILSRARLPREQKERIINLLNIALIR